MKKILNIIFSRKLIFIFLLLIQAVALIVLFTFLQSKFVPVYIALIILSGTIVYHIVNKNYNPAFKLAWVIPILVFPIFGGLIYVFIRTQVGIRLFKKELLAKVNETKYLLEQSDETVAEMSKENCNIKDLVYYIYKYGGFPACINTTVKYFESGENGFPEILAELEKAEHFIFIEFFIISEGKMWDQILEVLRRKAAQGVDIRIIYDGMGSQLILPDNYDKKLRSYGIKCNIFNKLKPFLSTSQNNRDHRKIIVIDGYVAFNGGINIADEYINIITRFGYWKDTAVMLKGEAVWNFTVMFLQIWDLIDNSTEDYSLFTPHKYHPAPFESDGIVVAYGDNPIDDENVGKNVYLHIINNAKRYLYISTPYLVLDNETFTSLIFAAKRGVDVKLFLPQIPDKWYIAYIGESYYTDLLTAGVNIYKYIPGFNHSKTFLSDDNVGICGSINLDYRSLYLHFECATLMYNTKCLEDMKKDFELSLDKCHKVTIEESYNNNIFKKILTALLRLFSPLL